jgi:hypothetical protein
VKESKKGSKTEMCGENLSRAKELKVVNEPNMTYPFRGRQCTDYIKVKKISFSKFTCKKLFTVHKLMEFGDI